jgi:ubiquinone biosynthesis protein UbiJ
MHALEQVLALVLQLSGTTSQKLYVLADRFISLVIREIRGRRLPGLIDEQGVLTLGTSTCRQRGENVSLTNKHSKLASTKAGYNQK